MLRKHEIIHHGYIHVYNVLENPPYSFGLGEKYGSKRTLCIKKREFHGLRLSLFVLKKNSRKAENALPHSRKSCQGTR